MAKWRKLLKYFMDADYRFITNSRYGGYKNWSDEAFLKRCYKARMKKALNLENPQTFNEKLQWLKLYNRKPIYTTMVDKHDVKAYVAERIGEEYIIPTLGVWDSFDEIDFDALPNQFVLKCTHDSGGLVICKDKACLDFEKARKKIEKSLKRDFFSSGREWPYKNVKPRIIAEQFMEDPETQELRDYKFFCFDGVVKALYVASDRQTPGEEVKFDFFDADYNHLNFRNVHKNAKVCPAKPKRFELMKELAAKLSAGVPHLRVDFYEVNGKVYFGEFTFFHMCGWTPFQPEEWDYTFGNWLQLPEKKR